jgi:hypothetical protein
VLQKGKQFELSASQVAPIALLIFNLCPDNIEDIMERGFMEHLADFATFSYLLYEHLLVKQGGEIFFHLWWKYPKNSRLIYDRQEYPLLSYVVVDVHVGFIIKKMLSSDCLHFHQYRNRYSICAE